MALQAAYETYLASANPSVLSDNVSLHYISTLTTINGAAAIARHNTAQGKVLKKKQERIIHSVEGQSSLCLDVDTSLEFISGGGAYLPGLDDNFVADRVVNFAVVHIVQFDPLGKIQQIRLYWDQGSLLKQVDVIGARAKSWPIRDGREQIRLISASVSSTEEDSRPSTAASSAAGQERERNKPRSESNNVTRDPHASLALFAPRNDDDTAEKPKVMAPKASAKPPPRPYGDLFVGDDSDAEDRNRSRSPRKGTGVIAPKSQAAKPLPRDYHDLFVGDESPSQNGGSSKSPSKNALKTPSTVAPKFGAGKNYQAPRLFDTEESDPTTPRSPEKGMRPHPKKYHHFEFGHGDDAPALDANRPKTKHQSQWDFEDFETPAKAPPSRARGDQSKQGFGWEEEEETIDSPIKKAPIHKPRPDATSNFEFRDDGTPRGERRTGPVLTGTKNAISRTGLYNDNIVGEDEGGTKNTQRPLSSITNVKDRRKDFDPHFEMTDQSPEHDSGAHKSSLPARSKPGDQTAVNWDVTDAEPPTASKKGNARLLSSLGNKENLGGNSGIKTSGDGMGGRSGQRTWGFGDESDG